MNNQHGLEALLASVYKRISVLSENDAEKSGYNIFSVLEVEDKEVIMCRMLCDLLNPYGMHGMGTKYLRSFLREVIDIPEGRLDQYLDKAEVYKEYQLVDPYRGTERRIDIVICNENHFIPIEVKIFASDQESQCYIYYEYASKYDNDAIVYYLTPTGNRWPSDKSMKLVCDKKQDELAEDKVKPLSFSQDILGWLQNIIDEETDERMRRVILQYFHAIESFCGTNDKRIREMVVDELLAKKENLAAGIEIGKYIKNAKIKLLKKIMTEFREQMKPIAEKYDLTELGAESWYAFEEKVDSFYDNSSYSSYPGINYRLNKAKLNDGREIWLRIEIDWNLFAGFCLFDTRVNEQIDVMNEADKDEIKQFLDYKRIDNEEWWISWKYLPTGSKESVDAVPEFHNMNEAAVSLADDDILHDVVKKSVEVIESEFLKKIK